MLNEIVGHGDTVADIESIVQWRVPDDFCALHQRYGRGVYDKSLKLVQCRGCLAC